MEEIIFGSYPQKPDEYVNGKRISIVDGKPQFNPLENQPIEWLVVSEDEEKMLLVSKHILECLPFNDWDTFDISWENCTLRAWMNGAFKYDEKSFADYFTEEEKSNVLPHEETGDCFFLLSLEEVIRFLPSNHDRKSALTANAAFRLPETFKTLREGGNCSWWLRTASDEADRFTMIVDSKGMYSKHGEMNNMKGTGVRPAVWIKK